MIQRGAQSPYLLMWIGNDEFLTERIDTQPTER